MRNPVLHFLIPCVLGVACATAAPEIRSTPASLASELVAQLDEGRVSEAERRFDDIREAQKDETLYPALFEVAKQRHVTEDYAGASRVLEKPLMKDDLLSALRELHTKKG